MALGGAEQFASLINIERVSGGKRRQPTGPERLGLVHIADTARDALIEKRISKARTRCGDIGESCNGDLDVRVRRAQVRSEMGNQCGGRGAAPVGANDRSRKADREPVADVDQRTHQVLTFEPALAGPIQMPRTRHLHVRLEHKAARKADEEMFACCVDRSDQLTRCRVVANKARCIETNEPLVQQRWPEPGCCSMDRVALGQTSVLDTYSAAEYENRATDDEEQHGVADKRRRLVTGDGQWRLRRRGCTGTARDR